RTSRPAHRDLHPAFPVTGDVAADQPGSGRRDGGDRPDEVDAFARLHDDPEALNTRRDADDRRRSGWSTDGRGFRDLPRVLGGGIADDRLMNLEATVDDVEEDGLAGRQVKGSRQERVVLGDQVDLARGTGGAGHDRRRRGRCAGLAGGGDDRRETEVYDETAHSTGRHGAKSMTRRTERGPALLDTSRRGTAQCGDP